MKKLTILVLFLSLLGNLFGLYLLDKAMHYRDHLSRIESRFANEGLRLREGEEISRVNLADQGVFVGGGLPRFWFFPKDFPFRLANLSGLEEPCETTFARFDRTVIQSGANFVIINAGFCDIFSAATQEKPLAPVLDSNMEYIKRMAFKARDHGIVPILSTLTPVRSKFLLPHLRRLDYSSKYKDEQNQANRELNRRLKKFSEAEGFPLIDFFAAVVDNQGELQVRYSLPDGEHLHSDGYAHLNGFLEKELRRIL